MRAVVRDKRLNLLKKYFPDFTISKKGNFVVTIGSKKSTRTIVHNGFNMTKGLIVKAGTKSIITTTDSDIVLVMAPTGKLLVKYGQARNFKRFNMKDIKHIDGMHFSKDGDEIKQKISEVFFVGRKYEYLLGHRELWPFKIFENFYSLKEAKIFLGMEFISDLDFRNIFHDNVHKKDEDDDDTWGVVNSSFETFDYITPIVLAKNKVNAYNLLKDIDKKTKELLGDYLEMCMTNDIEVVIPAGKNKLTELHDEVVLEIAVKNADKYSKKKVYKLDFPPRQQAESDRSHLFTKFWEYNNIQFRKLETPYDMYLQGCKQAHCIGSSYYNRLDAYSFYTIVWDGYEYEIQISPKGRINQFYGRRNSIPPKELVDIVRHENCDYVHTIKQIEGETLEDYPLIESKVDKDKSIGILDWL